MNRRIPKALAAMLGAVIFSFMLFQPQAQLFEPFNGPGLDTNKWQVAVQDSGTFDVNGALVFSGQTDAPAWDHLSIVSIPCCPRQVNNVPSWVSFDVVENGDAFYILGVFPSDLPLQDFGWNMPASIQIGFNGTEQFGGSVACLIRQFSEWDFSAGNGELTKTLKITFGLTDGASTEVTDVQGTQMVNSNADMGTGDAAACYKIALMYDNTEGIGTDITVDNVTCNAGNEIPAELSEFIAE